MPTSNSGTPNPSRFTRSTHRGRGSRGGSSSASPYAKLQSPSRPGCLSPSQPDKLPAGRDNRQQQHQFSDSEAETVSNPLHDPSPANINEKEETLKEIREECGVSEGLNDEHATLLPGGHPRVGDNTSSVPPASTSVQSEKENSSAAVGKQDEGITQQLSIFWHKAFDELKDIATHTCQELKTINGRLDKLDKVDLATEKLSKQVTGVLQRTTALEDLTSQNSNIIRELQDEVKGLKSTVQSQEEIITELQSLKSAVASQQGIIADLQSLKHEVPKIKENFTQKSQDQVHEFKRLIEVQQKQVDGFHDTNNKIQEVIQDNITQYFQERMDRWTADRDYKSLKDQANRNKNNLVIIGLQEEERSPLASASDFISSTLGIKNVHIDIAYRLGSPPPEGSSYARPILMRFTHMADRNKVWRRKTPITSEDGQSKIRIQQDLPKKLREDAQILNRVLRAATAHPKYQSAKIIDYKIIVNGKTYGPNKLEQLPKPLRPSSLATKTSDSVHIFFTRYSILSNHHPAQFTYKGVQYDNMEHYLAHQRALFSGDQDMIQRALDASDPLVAKAILNSLKKDRPQEWYDRVEKILIAGLREKFTQNPRLLNYLGETQHLHLGEASQDPRWGIGFSLDDQDALQHTKWLPNGNLLGRALTRVREEFFKEKNSEHSGPHRKPPQQVNKIQQVNKVSGPRSQNEAKDNATPTGATHNAQNKPKGNATPTTGSTENRPRPPQHSSKLPGQTNRESHPETDGPRASKEPAIQQVGKRLTKKPAIQQADENLPTQPIEKNMTKKPPLQQREQNTPQENSPAGEKEKKSRGKKNASFDKENPISKVKDSRNTSKEDK